MKATTIDEVIAQLESVAEEARRNSNPLGIFTLVYLGVTKSVKDEILRTNFQDGARMERLDVIFASRFLDAYNAYRKGQPCSRAWHSTFESAKRFDLLVMQHLLMGMNAHINLDLGIAASETVTANELHAVEADFNKINEMLTANIDVIQDKLSRISPLFFLLDWFGKRSDEHFAAFSLVQARLNSWKVANRMSMLSADDKTIEINELDNYVALLNKLICPPGVFFAGLFRFIKWFEIKDLGKILTVLS